MSRLYDATDKLIVDSREEFLHILADGAGPFYVYVLCSPPLATNMRPFYVGIGQSDRVFAHEGEARLPEAASRKVEEIRRIWDEQEAVIRVIDNFFDQEPWDREEELINSFGLMKDGTGILLNEQRYSPSHVRDGVELRKYVDDGNYLPENFIRRGTHLKVGPNTPRNRNSVYGKICSVLEHNSGITGAELVELLLEVDFAEIKSAYTKGGAVSRPWLAKYIDGGFYRKNRFIQDANDS